MSVLFTRSLGWLFPALKLQEPTVPTALETGVIPVADVLQGGFADPTIGGELSSFAAGLGANATNTLFQNTADEQSLIVALRADHGGGAGDLLWRLRLSERNPVFTQHIIQRSTAVGAQDSWLDISGTVDARIWVPPDWKADVIVPAGTAAGETLDIRYLRVRIPRGYSPW